MELNEATISTPSATPPKAATHQSDATTFLESPIRRVNRFAQNGIAQQTITTKQEDQNLPTTPTSTPSSPPSSPCTLQRGMATSARHDSMISRVSLDRPRWRVPRPPAHYECSGGLVNGRSGNEGERPRRAEGNE